MATRMGMVDRCGTPRCEAGRWQWPMRGVRIGEASNPGPLDAGIDVDMDELFDPTVVIEALGLEETQAPSIGDDATPMGQHVPPEVELVSPTPGPRSETGSLCPFSGPDGKHSPAFMDALLEKLRLLPEVSALPTYDFIPKSLTRRYGKLTAAAFEWWLEEVRQCDPGSNDVSRVCATLFLKHIDYVISRDTQLLNDRHKLQVGQERDYIHCAKIIRERLQRPEQGHWLEEVSSAITDSNETQTRMDQQRLCLKKLMSKSCKSIILKRPFTKL